STPAGLRLPSSDYTTTAGSAAFDDITQSGGTKLFDNTIATTFTTLAAPAGFQFLLYDTAQAQIAVSRFGLAALALTGVSTATLRQNVAIPTVGGVENFAAPFWDDLTMAADSSVWTKSIGSDTVIVQWTAMHALSAPSSS